MPAFPIPLNIRNDIGMTILIFSNLVLQSSRNNNFTNPIDLAELCELFVITLHGTCRRNEHRRLEMTRWIMEWFTISIVGVFGLSIMYVFSKVWSLIPTQVAASNLGAMQMEGKIALTLLFVIAVGCVKLFTSGNNK